MSGMCRDFSRSLPGGPSKGRDWPERSTGATASDLMASLVAALAEARLALDGLTRSLAPANREDS